MTTSEHKITTMGHKITTKSYKEKQMTIRLTTLLEKEAK